MSENTQKLAERIGSILQENESETSSFLRLSLEKINRRLDEIENKLESQKLSGIQSSPFTFNSTKHPSQEKFDIAEIIADEVIENLQNEKACPYEPAGKPCDHCAMCSSRGF